MDVSERNKLRQLANDALIASFGSDSTEQRLAEGLERCVEWIEETSTKCKTCSKCEDHGDDGDEFTVDVNEIIRCHGELKKRVAALKELHGKFDDIEEAADVPDLVGELSMQIEEFESEVDDLEAEVTL